MRAFLKSLALGLCLSAGFAIAGGDGLSPTPFQPKTCTNQALTSVTASLSTCTSLTSAYVSGTTGTGNFALATSPTLVTPILGTPQSVDLTNGTALPLSGLSGLGTGVATALGVNTGSAGATVLFNGALGTPSSGTLSSATGLPITTGVSGLATGVATVLGTPSSANLSAAITDETGSGSLVFGTAPTITLANGTGLPISTGVSGLGTGVATFLGTPTVANLGGAIGTQSANIVYAGPASGSAAAPTFRALAADDLRSRLLATSGVAVSIGSTTALTTLVDLTLPALGANDYLRLHLRWTINNGANTKSMLVYLDTTAVVSVNQSVTANVDMDVLIFNSNSASIQKTLLTYAISVGGVSTPVLVVPAASAIDTSAPKHLYIKGQKPTSTGDTVTLEAYTIEHMRV